MLTPHVLDPQVRKLTISEIPISWVLLLFFFGGTAGRREREDYPRRCSPSFLSFNFLCTIRIPFGVTAGDRQREDYQGGAVPVS